MVATFTLGEIPLPVDVAAVANEICEEATITPTQLYVKWEAWALANDKSTNVPSVKDLKQLAAHIRKTSTTTPTKSRSNVPKSLFYPARSTPKRINIDDFFTYLDAESHQPDTIAEPSPLAKPDFSDSPQNEADHPPPPNDDDIVMADPDASALRDDAPPDDVFANRTGSGRIEATLNSEVDTQLSPEDRGPIAVHCLKQAEWKDARYMNDDIPTRIETVRAHLKNLGDQILERIKHIRGEDGAPVATADAFLIKSPNVVMAVGRIRVELDESEGVVAGRINPNSVLLESVEGRLVKLNLKRIIDNKQPLFLNPGMVVVVEGINSTGRDIDVHAIYDNTMRIQNDRSSRTQSVDNATDEIMPIADTADKRPHVNVLVASGPFTTSVNLKYEPLEELIQVISRSSPDLLVLTGPFLDAQHEHIIENSDAAFADIFEKRILARLKSMLSELSASGKTEPQVMVIPSLGDIHHDFVCPQPAFTWSAGHKAHPNIRLRSNPCVLELSTKNETYQATVGITSLPTLQDISADSLCYHRGDRLGAIVSHMLRQKSFYPSYPPSSSVPLDTTFLDRLSIPDLETSPTVDVIIVPSRLKAFAKCVDGGAVAVNPGLLCRGSYGGTYAEISVPLHLSDRRRPSSLNEEKTKVNIVRL